MAITKELISKDCGKVVPDSVEDYVNAGGFTALKKALGMQPLEIIEEVKKSMLMGRGGAAYPTGIKWEQAYAIKKPKFVVCNADEGEPGTYKDKLILEKNPLRLIEGMTIAAFTQPDTHKGVIYIRGEYEKIQKTVMSAIANAKKAGYLGDNILGTGFNFDLVVSTGAGAYVCGENTALVESIEGKSGRPRIKPPFLKNVGLYLQPTLLNNVETFSTIPTIVNIGGDEYLSYGTPFSGGTKLVSLSGNLNKKGAYEVPFGTPVRDLVYGLGEGIANGRKLKFCQMGGSSGSCFPESLLDTQLCYEAFKKAGMSIGSGALLVVDDSNCVIDFLKTIMEFFVHESCGKCTPCREGNQRLLEILEKFSNGTAEMSDIDNLKKIANTMKITAFCGLGQASPTAILTLLKYFKDEFEAHVNKKCPANVCCFEKVEE